MHVILHTGAHCTDEDKLLKGLLRNADKWRHEGIAIPGPSRYRTLLSEVVNALSGQRPEPETREIVLDAILNDDPDRVERLVMSHRNFFCVPRLTLADGRLYRHAERRLTTFCDIFDQDEVEVFMGLRNPATFLPQVFAATPGDELGTFLAGCDPMHLRWSDLVRRIRMAVPEVPLTLWANEDTPFIWGEIKRRMAGIELTRKITGSFDLFSSIITREGMQRYRAFLHENPTINEYQKRQAMMVLLDKFALDDEIEEGIDLPGWDAVYVDMLTELYEEDLHVIGQMDDVVLIRP